MSHSSRFKFHGRESNVSHSVVSNSLWHHGLQLARLLCPWGFPRQENWGGLPFLSPGDLPGPGIKPGSPALQADSLPSEPLGKPLGRESNWPLLDHMPISWASECWNLNRQLNQDCIHYKGGVPKEKSRYFSAYKVHFLNLLHTLGDMVPRNSGITSDISIISDGRERITGNDSKWPGWMTALHVGLGYWVGH